MSREETKRRSKIGENLMRDLKALQVAFNEGLCTIGELVSMQELKIREAKAKIDGKSYETSRVH